MKGTLVLALAWATTAAAAAAAVTKGTIVGAGRIGNLLWQPNNQQDKLLTRQDRSDEGGLLASGPIYLCTRNADLEKIINDCPQSRRGDLVFLQNGVLTEYLAEKGLDSPSTTQGLVYFAVSKKGEKPIDGITDLNPEGLTAVTGKWAEDLQARLAMGGLKCHVLDKATWTVAMLEKHIWICAFMAVGAKHKGITVGEVESGAETGPEVRALIDELAAAASARCKVTFTADVADRLCAYARSVAHFPTALKEQEWRNGWFCDWTFEKVAQLQPDPCPRHTAIMESQRLLFAARKRWARKTLAARDAARTFFEAEREQDRYRQRGPAQAAAAFPPLTTSPTVLMRNKSPRVQQMIEDHDKAWTAALAQAEEEQRLQQQQQLAVDAAGGYN